MRQRPHSYHPLASRTPECELILSLLDNIHSAQPVRSVGRLPLDFPFPYQLDPLEIFRKTDASSDQKRYKHPFDYDDINKSKSQIDTYPMINEN
jgi:hypothetical protein